MAFLGGVGSFFSKNKHILSGVAGFLAGNLIHNQAIKDAVVALVQALGK